MIKSSDPRFGSTVMQLTNIVRMEPDSGFVLSPSQLRGDQRALENEPARLLALVSRDRGEAVFYRPNFCIPRRSLPSSIT